MALPDEKHISFTTYRRSGEAVSTPVWCNPVSDGRLGFCTAMGSGKTKRLKNDPRVAVQPSDARGHVKTGTERSHGTAEMVQSGPLFEEVRRRTREKYGFLDTLSKVFYAIGPPRRKGLTYADTVVLVRLDA